LHSVRDPDKWFESTQATIFAPGSPTTAKDGPMWRFFSSFIDEFADHMHDRAFMTAYFRRHSEEVKRTIAPEHLLAYEAGQGWEPLCKFLGVPAPDAPYPSENSREDFIARLRARSGP